jgi:integral membrane sensor domain MASE1
LKPVSAHYCCANAPWYNPLQNLNDWIRLAIGSALMPPLVGGVLVSFLFPARSPA